MTDTASVSYTQYSTYQTCPLQWKLRYIDGYKDTPTIDLVFGTAMHEAVQEWVLRLYNGTDVQAKHFDLAEYFKERLFVGFDERLVVKNEDGTKEFLVTKDVMIEYYNDGVAILKYIQQNGKDWFRTKRHKLLGIEMELKHEIFEGLSYKGYIDLVIYDETSKKYYIYDLKTSKSGWRDYHKKDTKKTDQLLLYKRFFAKLFDASEDDIIVQFLVMRRKLFNSKFEVPRLSAWEPSHGKISMKKAVDRFTSFITEAFTDTGTPRLDNIKATPSEQNCRFCPFRNDKSLCSESFYLKKD